MQISLIQLIISIGNCLEKKQFIKNLGNKDNIDSLFLVKYIALVESKDGRTYLNMIVADATGDLEVKKWQGAEEVAEQISRGDYVEIQGKINSYQNRLQLIASEIRPAVKDNLRREDFVQVSANPPDRMFGELMAIVETLDDVYIKDFLHATLYDPEISRRLKIWAAGKSIHHCYEGGLLEHTLSSVKLAVLLSAHYAVNRNYVVAGAVFHDIAKIYELSDGDLVDYTEEGKLIGHLIKSFELLDRFTAKITNFPHTTKMHLRHILASHHGEYEFGSPKTPQTSEALLVHHIDLIDSKMNSFETAKRQDNSLGHWTGLVKHLNRIVYKGELPTFREYLKTPEGVQQSNEEVVAVSAKKSQKKNEKGELKHSFGDHLKNFKVNNNDNDNDNT